MDYPVVKIEKKHIKSVAELEQICFPCPWNEEQFADALDDKFIGLFGICTENERVISYLLCSHIGDYAEVLNIATHPEYRGQGFAKKLLNHWLLQPELANVHIVLEVREKNIPAQNLYAQFGFRQIHVRKNYYGDEDALVMERQ